MGEKIFNFFDIDKTLTPDYIVFDIVQSEEESGLLTPGTYSKIFQSRARYSNGYLNYEQFVEYILKQWGKGLVGQNFSDLKEHSKLWISANEFKFYPFARQVFHLLACHDNWLVTAEADFIATAITEYLGISGALTTIYETNYDNTFSGNIKRQMVTSSDKLNAINDLVKPYFAKIKFSFGDSDADIDMLSIAETAICVNPTAKLSTVAAIRNWIVTNEEDVIYYVTSNI